MNKESKLASCYFRDDEFSDFFTALKDSEIHFSQTAAILRQLFGEVMAGTNEKGPTSFKNIFPFGGDKDLTTLWESYGRNAALPAICKIALKRGAKISEIRAFLRAFRGEKVAHGAIFKKELLDKLASKIHYCDDEEYEYQEGEFDFNGRLHSFRGYRVHRAGGAYFVEGMQGLSHWPGVSEGKMWVKK